MLSFVESKLFTRLGGDYLTDDAYAELQTIYAKNEEQNIPAHILRRIKEEFDG